MFDAARLPPRAATAFVDRTAINWQALLLRMRSPNGRELLENLRRLDAIRPHQPRSVVFCRDAGMLAIWLVLVVSTIQTVCALAVLAGALANGVSVTRGAQGFLACAFAAGGLLLARSRDSRSICLAAWFGIVANVFVRSTVSGLPVSSQASVDVLLRAISIEAFAPACLWRFALDFPYVYRFTRFDVVVARLTKGVWILGLALFAVNLAAEWFGAKPSAARYFLRADPSGWFWHLWTLATVPPIAMILLRSRRARLPERRKVARLAAAVCAGTVPFLVLGIVLATSPGIYERLAETDAPERRWVDGVVLGGLAATPLLATAALIADRPFGLRSLVLSRPAYAMIRALINTAPMVSLALLGGVLYRHRYQSLAELLSGSPAISLLATIGVTALFAARQRLLDAVDRFVSRRAAEHQAQLAHALERIRLARGVREIGAVLATELRRGTGAATVTVLRAARADRFDAMLPGTTSLSGDTALVAILNDTGGPVDVSDDSELRRLLPGRDREWVASSDVALIAPLKHRDEELAAIIALSPKRRGLPFDGRDLWLVATLTTSAAAAWSEADDAADRSGVPGVHARGNQTVEAAYECPRCGVVAGAPPLPCACGASPTLAPLPARIRDSLVVQRRLGIGGMGVVYLARDVPLDRDVALKTLPRLAPGAVARLRGEAQAMGALNHESLATIYGFHVWRRTPILIVEYFPRGTLARRLAGCAIPAEDAVALGIALLQALVYMHARGVLHRDIKPSNIAFTATGTPKLLDFGLAELAESTAASTRTEAARHTAPRAGTLAYLPPEAFDGDPPNVQYDLWALALVLMESVTGVHPFANAHDAGVALDRRWTARVGERALAVAAPALARVLERALDARPARRFQTASDLLTALRTI